MNVLSQLALTLCYLSVAVTVMSLFVPQKRTRKIFCFVIGLFVIASIVLGVRNLTISEDIDLSDLNTAQMPEYSESDYNDMILRRTADNLVKATDEILRSEGIEAEDIRLSLKISDEGRIYVDRAVIYISEDDLLRRQEIKSIISRNLSKEPLVYVQKEVERTDEE